MQNVEFMTLFVNLFTIIVLGTAIYKAIRGKMKQSAAWSGFYIAVLSTILLITQT